MRYEVLDLVNLLKNVFFDEAYNSEENPFDTLTYDFGKPSTIKLPNGQELKYEGNMYSVLEDVELFINCVKNEEIDEKCCKRMDKYIHRGNPCQPMSFYTIVPKERLPFTEVNIKKMRDVCESLFFQEKLFKKTWWVVECGKHEDNPNLHIHALVEFMDSKNFRRSLLTVWKKHFPDPIYRIDYKVKHNVGIHRVGCNTERIQQDKVKYLTNENKGSHENFKDLGISGIFNSESITSHFN